MTPIVLPGLGSFIDHALEGNVRGIQEVMERALDVGHSPKQVLAGLVEPALAQVGDSWESGECTVAHEHLATSTATSALHLFGATHLLEDDASAPLAVVGCVELEQHGVGAHLLAWLLRGEGWRVLDLGPNVPLGDFVSLVDERRVDAICISATLRDRLPRVLDTLASLRSHPGCRFALVAVGGQAVRGDEARLLDYGADVVSTDALHGARRVQELHLSRGAARARAPT